MQSNRYHAMGPFSLSLLVLSLVLLGTSADALAQDRTALMDRYEQLTIEFKTANALHEYNATPATKKALDRTMEALVEFKRANRATLEQAKPGQPLSRVPFAQKTEPIIMVPQGSHTTYSSGIIDVPIPDAGGGTVSVEIEVPDAGVILDVNVPVRIEHTWIGDLVIDVTSPAGTTVLLAQNYCEGPSLGIDATFDDDGLGFCTGPVLTGPIIPLTPLSAFNGQDLLGTWTLTVFDDTGSDTGTLNEWALIISFDPPPEIDLELDKTCKADDDGTGSYHITLSNTSDTDATGIVVTDWLPGAIDDVDGDPDQGTFNNATGVWTVGDLAAGSSTSLWIDFTFDLDVPGRYLNHAEVTAADLPPDSDSEPDDGMGDDYAECGFVVLADRSVPDFVPENARGNADRGRVFNADLEVKKSVDVETASAGSMVHYTVTVGNNGPHSTTKVQVTDHLPDCLTDATWTTTRGTYDGWFWDISAIKVGETLTLEVWATVGETCDGTVTNKAWVSKSALPDPSVSPLDPDAPVENPFDERETLRNNHDEASFDVDTGSGRALEGTVFALGRNYPNPFNPTTVVPFSLAEASQVSIKVYDLLGREMAVLVDGAMSAGVHEVTFEASALPTGVYLIRMEAAGTVHIQRVALMK